MHISPLLHFILELVYFVLTDIHLPIAAPRIVHLHVRLVYCLSFVVVCLPEPFHKVAPVTEMAVA